MVADASHGRAFWLLVVVLIELVDIQTASSLMHVNGAVHRTVDLNRLRSIPLLRVQLTPIHRLYLHHIVALWVTRPLHIIRRGYDGLPRRIEAKVSLIHELLIETRIDRRVVVLNGLIGSRWSGVRVHLLCSILEQLV